jgi:hypothetical protein
MDPVLFIFSSCLLFFWMQVIVVKKASATYLADEYMMLGANHIDICKPVNKMDDGYIKLLDLLIQIMEPEAERN